MWACSPIKLRRNHPFVSSTNKTRGALRRKTTALNHKNGVFSTRARPTGVIKGAFFALSWWTTVRIQLIDQSRGSCREDWGEDNLNSGAAIFAKAFMGIPAQQAAKTTRPLNACGCPSQPSFFRWIPTNIILAMTRRDVEKPAFSLRKKRSWKHMHYRFWGLLDSCLATKEKTLFWSSLSYPLNRRGVLRFALNVYLECKP